MPEIKSEILKLISGNESLIIDTSCYLTNALDMVYYY